MKFVALTIQAGREPWLDEVIAIYTKKLTPFFSARGGAKADPGFKVQTVKPKTAQRDEQKIKKDHEAQALLAQLEPEDLVVLLTEDGQSSQNSQHFAKLISQFFESGKSRVVFIVCGAYGASEALRQRANKQISLSPLTLNHHMALAVLLEQLYRAFTLRKGLPYHN